ncbi:unknown [Alistipes sp. CAG:435]|nr:unknown [Alistipes sp. CAG:435]
MRTSSRFFHYMILSYRKFKENMFGEVGKIANLS